MTVPPNERQILVAALEAGMLEPPYSEAAIKSVGAVSCDPEPVIVLLEKLRGRGLTPAATAAWIEAVEPFLERRPVADLVWSGPEVPGVPARDTRRVFEEMVNEATRSIWLSTYAFFDGKKAFDRLARRMDEIEMLEVMLLLNIERRRNDSTVAEDLVRRFADRFWGTEWPGARRPQVYYDPRSLEPDGTKGVLHAKVMVVDERRAFITSANLTEAAFDRNIEAGLLVGDRLVAMGVVRQLLGRADGTTDSRRVVRR